MDSKELKGILSRQRFVGITYDGTPLTVRKLNALERAAILEVSEKAKDKPKPEQLKDLTAIQIALYLGDTEGQRIYDNDHINETLELPEDLQELILITAKPEAKEKKTTVS